MANIAFQEVIALKPTVWETVAGTVGSWSAETVTHVGERQREILLDEINRVHDQSLRVSLDGFKPKSTDPLFISAGHSLCAMLALRIADRPANVFPVVIPLKSELSVMPVSFLSEPLNGLFPAVETNSLAKKPGFESLREMFAIMPGAIPKYVRPVYPVVLHTIKSMMTKTDAIINSVSFWSEQPKRPSEKERIRSAERSKWTRSMLGELSHELN